MNRMFVVIRNAAARVRAAEILSRVPDGWRVDFKPPLRTLEQNGKMWACLSDIAQQLDWHGVKLQPSDWKLIFLDALKKEMRIVPNLDGDGFVNLGQSSSALTKAEMSDMIELIIAFGTQKGVKFHDPLEYADDAQRA